MVEKVQPTRYLLFQAKWA